MPLDSLFMRSKYLSWEEKFCFLPHRCSLSNRLLWFTKAMKATMTITGPGEPVQLTYWQDKNEHLLWKIKQ